jgi:spermidine/putrescine transport system permease protein
LLTPATLWLLALFVTPLVFMIVLSLEEPVQGSGIFTQGYRFAWNFSTYSEAIGSFGPQFVRSLTYALVVTASTIVIGYPVAYWLAFRARRWRPLLVLVLLLPFFVSFVIRSVTWQFILSDNGPVLSALKGVGLLPAEFHVLATPAAVIAGITYNSLPFMILPIFVALERLDHRLVEAAKDLYADGTSTFLTVVLPLSMPGVIAGMLLTFVPAAGDYVNARILGNTDTSLVGNVIQYQFLQVSDYPLAAALGVLMMLAVAIPLVAYGRVMGARSIEGFAG